jgi:hypothetical protein
MRTAGCGLWSRISAVVVAGQEAGLAREFNIPNDHGHPQTYSQHYSQYVYVFGPGLMAATSWPRPKLSPPPPAARVSE